jgi:hypothetical protein
MRCISIVVARGAGRQRRFFSQERQFLRANPICTGTAQLHAAGLAWYYCDRPTPLSREYFMRIFQRGETPSVFVVDPDLAALAGGRPRPHIYHQLLRLCLALPGTRERAGTMRID